MSTVYGLIILSTFVRLVSAIFLLVICFFMWFFLVSRNTHDVRERSTLISSYTLIFQQGNEKKKSQEGRDLENFTTDSRATSSLRFILRQSCNSIKNWFYRILLIDIVAVYFTSFTSNLINNSIFVGRNNICRKYS